MTTISCSSEADFVPIEKITNSGIIYSNDDFKKIGFKESISYEVSDLPNVITAHYGFIKNELSKPEDYEIRFYANHQDAVKIGTKYAENITGENGCIRKECSLWIKNLKHRQKISEPANVAGGAGNGRGPLAVHSVRPGDIPVPSLPVPEREEYVLANFCFRKDGAEERGVQERAPGHCE